MGKKAQFYSIGSLRDKHPNWYKQDLKELFELLGKGKIKPIIADHFPMEKATKVHELIENRNLQGKIILDIN